MDTIKIYSTVLSSVKKTLLIRGVIFGLSGAILITAIGIWAPLPLLEAWGFLTFCVGIFLIGWGLIPYRKLTKLETQPHQLHINPSSITFLSSKGRVKIFDLGEIVNVSYWESNTRYGLFLELKSSRVFLPHFLSNSCLDEIVHTNQSHKRS